MEPLLTRRRKGALATFLLSLFLGLSVLSSYLVATVAEKDRFLSVAVQNAIFLLNQARSGQERGPRALIRAVEQFQSEVILWVGVIGPHGGLIASSGSRPPTPPLSQEALDFVRKKKEMYGDVISTESGRIFRVIIPFERLHHRFPPGQPPPWLEPEPPPFLGTEASQFLVVIDVDTSEGKWLWTWAFAQGSATIVAIVFLWGWWFRTKKQEEMIAQLEHERREQESLARLGEMSAVLAHEIRNPLGSMKGNLQLVMEKQVEEGIKERIQIVLENVQRIERLVKGLLDYAKEPRIQTRKLRLLDVVSSALDLAGLHEGENQVGGRIIVVALEGAMDAMVEVGYEEMTRAFLNIIENAKEALEDKGKIRISAEKGEREIKVLFEDSGSGIEPEVTDKLFQPFFTTKAKGVGLGLAIAQKIINAHGGEVRAYRSLKLGGACFEVRLKCTG
jgi:two-component system sensor histidine kinase HydH